MRKDLLAPLIVLVGLTSMVAVADSTGASPDVRPPAPGDSADTSDTGTDTAADTGTDTAVDTGTDTAADTGAAGDSGGTDTSTDTSTDTDTTDTAGDTAGAVVPTRSAAQRAGEKGGFGCTTAPLGVAPGFGLLLGAAALGRRRRQL